MFFENPLSIYLGFGSQVVLALHYSKLQHGQTYDKYYQLYDDYLVIFFTMASALDFGSPFTKGNKHIHTYL